MDDTEEDDRNLPALITRCQFRLEKAKTSAEALEVRAMAEAALHLAKVVRASNLVQVDCLRMIDRAEKLIGEKLIEAKERGEVAKVGQPKVSSTAARIKDLGITHDQAAYFQWRAKTPDRVVHQVFLKAIQEGCLPRKDLRDAIKDTQSAKQRTPRRRKGRTPDQASDIAERYWVKEMGGWVMSATPAGAEAPAGQISEFHHAYYYTSANLQFASDFL